VRSPDWEPPAKGETGKQARARRARNKVARDEYTRWITARCKACGQVRINVVHEQNPAESPEGEAYHADIVHHRFVPA
jgi:hypothetical protein